MKTNNKNTNQIRYSRLESFLRNRLIIVVVIWFMALGMFKFGSRFVSIIKASYVTNSTSLVSFYTPVREEVIRIPVDYNTGVRVTTISGA